MKSKLIGVLRALLCTGFFVFAATTAAQADKPLSRPDMGYLKLAFTSVSLDHCPPGDCISVARGVTDSNGAVTFRDLKPGHYFIVIDGPSLIAAIDKLAPPPAKKHSSSSITIGGGLFGGNSRSSSSHEGERRSHSSSGGGMGLGLSVPLGGGERDAGASGTPSVRLVIFGANTDNGKGNLTEFSSETPYCRDTAGQGMRIGFTVPKDGGALTITVESAGYTKAGGAAR